MEILREIYARELPSLFHFLRKRERDRELRQAIDLKLTYDMMISTAGMSPDIEMVKELSNLLHQRILMLSPPVIIEPETPEDPYRKLERLRKLIAENRIGKSKEGD